MPIRVARLVTITWGDGDIEQYEHVEVLEVLATRHGEEPFTYKTMTVCEKKRVGTND